jgi:16S rRNA (guanine(966)-N(2))-methyltransferase RsmD
MKKDNIIKRFKTNIIAGKYKGKSIEIPNIYTTRSSKSILRESLFNTLQFDIIDKNFVEVFAGSGSIGLEAISRGAKKAFFIEKNRIVYNTLVKNIKSIDTNSSISIYGDSFDKFNIILEEIKRDKTPTYFYFDPPFSTRNGMDDIYKKTLDLILQIDISTCEMVIIEHMTKLDFPTKIGELQLQKKKKFGRSSLSYLIKQN